MNSTVVLTLTLHWCEGDLDLNGGIDFGDRSSARVTLLNRGIDCGEQTGARVTLNSTVLLTFGSEGVQG